MPSASVTYRGITATVEITDGENFPERYVDVALVIEPGTRRGVDARAYSAAVPVPAGAAGPQVRWKVVNRHGMKIDGAPLTSAEAEEKHAAVTDRGYDDAPFTILRWGEALDWFGAEGHDEAAEEAATL